MNVIAIATQLWKPKKLVYNSKAVFGEKARVAAIIPTFNPDSALYRLVTALHAYNPSMHIVVVDDCTTSKYPHNSVLNKINNLSAKNDQITLIHTPENKLKAAATNFGLTYIKNSQTHPDVIVTFDDDVEVEPNTIALLVKALQENAEIGAACSQVRVVNKNKNLLTRLQALEYHGFNISKIADNGFIQGPLVMQGMLVAFRYSALIEVGGFTAKHLIEDYDITARLKQHGWQVMVQPGAAAWTEVPTQFGKLWRQRVRWTTGGLQVVTSHLRYIPSIIQDLIGHLSFIFMMTFITLSFMLPNHQEASPLVQLLILFAIFQFFISFVFNVFTLLVYQDADIVDWLIRLSLIPEFIYSNILSWLLIGTYSYFLYKRIVSKLLEMVPGLKKISQASKKTFFEFGYSDTWGTR
ncbi:glycosyltransferase family 2 protein [candidate division WWE3 bacterium]|uniref:Glycosyltransferase family 2 protein n=1 Tax=candidate division WWE3 bacterium TaxID=2053526 RepID=A0A955RP64_UNCKA|nr:glycosyltransferase family 2 protein [candidate division WWE3 bacterium]